MRLLVSDAVTGGKLPILCNQENFQLRDNSYRLNQALPGFKLLIKPAVKNDLNYGRPSNGMFIAFPDTIMNQVKDVSPDFWRIQAAKIQFKSSTLLLINSYFPTDPQRNNMDETELLDTLSHIKLVIEQNHFDTVLWAGDINSDFSRDSSHTRQVQDAVDEIRLLSSWRKFPVDFTATFEMMDRSFTSTLDHFFWNSLLDSSVVDAGVLHLPDNMSDHSPIYCIINTSSIQHDHSKPKKSKPCPSWRRAKPEEKTEYKRMLEENMARLIPPDSVARCMDVHCQDPRHREELDQFTLEILETVQKVAEESLPVPGNSSTQKKSIRPGWRGDVKPYRDEAYFWHQVWKSYGRPVNNQLHSLMKKTRNQYHYQYKKSRKAEERIKRSKLLSACLGEGGDLFGEIKKLRKSSPTVASSIDGVTQNISEHFGSIYSDLYNSADDAEELKEVEKRVGTLVNSSSINNVLKITPDLVKQAANKLKPGKSDPVYSFSSDCFKNGTDALYEHLALVLRCCTVHSHVSLALLIATLVPLVKDKLGDTQSSKNYRSVAISSILLKLIDWVIILLEGSSLGLNELQFAYQAGCSTVMCTWAALETVDYFLKNGSEVFSCATDMSKAFDLTLHSLMFTKMIDAGLSPIFVRLMIFIYSHQVANVRWNGDLSSNFTVRNGCGQGKVLAAIAYCMYCEELFSILKRKRSGCWIMGYYRGIFGYSDDNWLLAPSLSALQDIINTCEEYAASHNLRFSTDLDPVKCKTKCIAFLTKDRDLPSMYLCGNPLPWVNNFLHLGNRVTNKVNGGQLDMKQKKARYIDKTCSINQEFYFAHPVTKMKLNKLYNCHFSGSQTWNLFSPGAASWEGTYNKSVRIMAGVPLETHRYLIEPLSGMPPMKLQLVKSYLGFMNRVKESTKPVLRQLFSIAKQDVRTTTGSNMRNILLLTDCISIDELHPDIVKTINYNKIDSTDMWRVDLVKELIEIKLGNLETPEGWTSDELDQVMNFACTG